MCEIYDKCGGYKYPFIFDDSSQFAFLNPVCEKETQKKGEIFKSQKGVSHLCPEAICQILFAKSGADREAPLPPTTSITACCLRLWTQTYHQSSCSSWVMPHIIVVVMMMNPNAL